MISPLEVVGSYMDRAPVDVSGLAHELGLHLEYAYLPENVSGKIESAGKSYLITVNRSHGEKRQRFTIAHEIAHFVLHRDLIGDGIEDDGLYRSNQPNTVERQANQYAADILMPRKLVRRMFIQNGISSANELSTIFNVSSAVAEIRLKELDLD